MTDANKTGIEPNACYNITTYLVQYLFAQTIYLISALNTDLVKGT